tara:strand:- start:887 stop:1864 length:978 start_codon:yes stop_codon:yes gene_type:complete
MSILGLSSFTADDDRRQSYQANQQRAAVNAAREFDATFGNPKYVMSQPAEFYTNRDNLAKIKPTLVAMKGNKDFYTTDQNESRNMYQMLMNKMKGGQGAEMIDTRGLPAGAYRTGRTLFQDPSKSAGFLGDMSSMFLRTPNPAAVRVNTYNPFPKAGFGKEFYEKEFPITSAFSNAMEKIENLPTLQLIKSFLPQRNKPVLERDPDFVKTDEELAEMGAYESLPMLEFNDLDPDMSTVDVLDQSPSGPFSEEYEMLEAYNRGEFPAGEFVAPNFGQDQLTSEEIRDLLEFYSTDQIKNGLQAGLTYEDMIEFTTGNIGSENPLQN